MLNESPKIDIIDYKILFELDKNSRIPITILARKLKISREIAKYRIKRLQDIGLIRNFNAIINPAKLGYIIFKVYLKLQNLTKVKEQELVDYCIQHKNIFWIAKCDGNYDLIFGVYVHTIIEFNDILLDFMGNFSQYIFSRHISNSVYVDINRRNYLTNTESEIVTWGGAPSREELDNLSKEILKNIAADSRITIVELCQKLKSNSKTIIVKIKNMEHKRIILGYRINIDLKKIKKEYFKAIIYFQNISEKKENSFKEFCKQNHNICYYIKNIAEWDVELDIEIENYEKFNMLIREIKEKFPDIIRTIETVFISEELKGELNIVKNM